MVVMFCLFVDPGGVSFGHCLCVSEITQWDAGSHLGCMNLLTVARESWLLPILDFIFSIEHREKRPIRRGELPCRGTQRRMRTAKDEL